MGTFHSFYGPTYTWTICLIVYFLLKPVAVPGLFCKEIIMEIIINLSCVSEFVFLGKWNVSCPCLWQINYIECILYLHYRLASVICWCISKELLLKLFSNFSLQSRECNIPYYCSLISDTNVGKITSLIYANVKVSWLFFFFFCVYRRSVLLKLRYRK